MVPVLVGLGQGLDMKWLDGLQPFAKSCHVAGTSEEKVWLD